MHGLPFSSNPLLVHQCGDFIIADFQDSTVNNIDDKTVKSFGDEWKNFNQFNDEDIKTAGDQYFDIVSEKILGKDKISLDLGCGSGRWTKYLAPHVGFIEAIDPSEAVFAAARLLKGISNVRITKASADNIPFSNDSFDFIFSLGVLHHVPDTLRAIQSAVKKLKRNGYFHLYLYYNLDNRGPVFHFLFHLSNFFRKIISSLPPIGKRFICDTIALFVYVPFVLLAKLLRVLRIEAYNNIPLSFYIDKRFYIIRNDALDRFGTPLEQRFSRENIRKMMEKAGLTEIIFSEHAPYWHAIGKKI